MQLTSEQLKQYQDEGSGFLGTVLSDEQLESLRIEEARFLPRVALMKANPARTSSAKWRRIRRCCAK
jgi:hypothetical protein